MRLSIKKHLANHHKRYVVIVIAVILLGVVSSAFVIRHKYATTTANTKPTSVRPLNTVDLTPATPSDNAGNESRKGNPASSGATLDSPTQGADFNVSVDYATADTAGKLVRVRAHINGATSGTCNLTATHAGAADVIASSQVSLQNNTYSCGNFDIPFDSFTTKGDWHISVAVTNNNTTARGSWPDVVTVPN